MVLYWTRSHSFIRFRGCGTAVLLPNKRSGREVQPLAALYPTVRLSPWRQVRKNIHSRVWTPGPTWSVLHPGGPPSWFPSVPSDWGIWASPYWRLIRTSCPGWLPPVPPDLVSPQESSSPGPPTPRVVVRFPATQNFAYYSLVVSFIYIIAAKPTLYRKRVH